MPQAKPRFCAAGLNLRFLKSLSRAGFPCAGSPNLHILVLKLAERFLRSKKIIAKYTITSARRVPLRCGTQFAPYLALIVLRMTVKLVGDKVS